MSAGASLIALAALGMAPAAHAGPLPTRQAGVAEVQAPSESGQAAKPQILPLPPAEPFTPEQTVAEREQLMKLATRAGQLLQAAPQSGSRDDALKLYAETMIELGQFDPAAQALALYEYKSTGTRDILYTIARRMCVAKDVERVSQALQMANALTGQVVGEFGQALLATDTTREAALYGDAAALRAQFDATHRVFSVAAGRDPSGVGYLLELADAAPGLERAGYDTKSLFADLSRRIDQLARDNTNPRWPATLARVMFHAGLFDDAVARIDLGNERLVELYVSAARVARAPAGETFDAAFADTAASLASSSDYERFAVFGLAARALHFAGRDEAALRVALSAELARRAHNRVHAELRNQPGFYATMTASALMHALPGEGSEPVKEVVEHAVWRGRLEPLLAVLRALPEGAAERVAIPDANGGVGSGSVVGAAIDTAAITLLDMQDLDRATALLEAERASVRRAPQQLMPALLRAGRLADAERVIFPDGLPADQHAALWAERLALADAWLAAGDPQKARAHLVAAEKAAVELHTSLGKTVLPLQPGELPRIMVDKDPETGNYLGRWRYPAEPAEVAMGWIRAGDPDAARKLLGSFHEHFMTQAKLPLAELERHAVAREFEAFVARLEPLTDLTGENSGWWSRRRPLCVALARAGQWNLLDAVAERLPAPERAAPYCFAFGVLGARITAEAALQPK
jgi:hypothetical protein